MSIPLRYLIRILKIKTLLSHHHEEQVEGYCKNCPNYAKRHTCPPFSFSKRDYLSPYSHVILVGSKWEQEDIPKKFWKKESMMELFEVMRKETAKNVLSLENFIPHSEALLVGTCTNCSPCKKEKNLPCPRKKELRFSLEALGFLVGDIAEKELLCPLLWQKEEMIPYHLSVAALLTKKEPSYEAVKLHFSSCSEKVPIFLPSDL